MAIQNEPTRITIPFAASGTKNSIPDTQPSPSASQAASWTDGFPAQCSLPLSAGGIPPARADFNGIFNAITQSERFTQEGGVWLWSNAVDYAASRMVLGSDGKLYWSAAQSGPNVGGAVDPTTDSGAYWVKLPSMADIAAQNYATQGWIAAQNYATQGWVSSLGYATQTWVGNQGYATQTWVGNQDYATQTWVGNQGYATQTWVGNQGYATQTWVGNQGYATQAWVKGISVAFIYLDPAGNDSNDGLSASTAVATFDKAFQIAMSFPTAAGHGMVIQVAAGTYTGDISLNNSQCRLLLQGNVTLTGHISIVNSNLLVSGSPYTLTVEASSAYAAIEVTQNSYALFVCALAARQGSTGGGIVASIGSTVYFLDNVTLNGNGSGVVGLSITDSSLGYFQGSFVFADNAGYSNGVVIRGSSHALFANGLWIGDGGVSTYTGLAVTNASSCVFTGGSVSLRGGAGVAGVVDVVNGSSIRVESGVANISFLMYASSGPSLLVERGGSFVCETTGYIYFGPSSVNCTTAIYSSSGSSVSFIGDGIIDIEGTYNTIVECYGDSYVLYDKRKTSNTTPNGKRYFANYCSSIDVSGAGDNHIPGTTPGSVDHNSYYG